jgi:hypothetical protein
VFGRFVGGRSHLHHWSCTRLFHVP